jgi:hypothetical protein
MTPRPDMYFQRSPETKSKPTFSHFLNFCFLFKRVTTENNILPQQNQNKQAMAPSEDTRMALKDADGASMKSDDSSIGGGPVNSIHSSTGTTSGGNSEDISKEIQEELTKKESMAVFRLRLTVLGVLLLTAGRSSQLMYL